MIAGDKFCGRCGTAIEPTRESPWNLERTRGALGAASFDASTPAVEQEGRARGRRVGGAAVAGERRQLTVLFCDLVGSTGIAAQLDPEEWRDIAAQYQRSAAEAVTRFDGYVAKFLGDGLVVFFGYPHAHEDDPERAVRAGLAIVDAVRKLPPARNSRGAHNTPLHVRVGIHTGPVVVGLGGGDAPDVFGNTPNVAALVQAAAEPNRVLITDATQRLVAGQFVVEEPRTERLKGIPVVLYRVCHASGVRGRLHAAARGLTPFVGRDDERRLLRRRWELAQAGEGQVVLITGEAGIGKSRLVQQLKEDLGSTPHTWVECGGSPFFAHTALHPISELLRQAFVWQHDLSDDARLAVLAQALSAAGLNPAEAVPLIGPLLDLSPPEGRYPPLLLSAEQQRKKLLATFIAWVLAAARVQPTVIVTEDLHWVDPSTLELNGLLADQGATVPLLLVYTARPEFRNPWPVRSHHTQLTLNRLSKQQAREMILRVRTRVLPPDHAVETLLERTDGVPLFLEELTRAVVETQAASVSEREIPTTLQDSLMARLDRLGAAKEVAQIAAVIGREFSYALLHAAVGAARQPPFPDAALEAALERLTDAELLYARGRPPGARYTFKHALIRETAYESLLKSRRRELHRVIATLFTEQISQTPDAQPEVVAQHWQAAGETERAVAAWQQAGERASARFASAEAIAHYTKALETFATLPDAAARVQQEFLLQVQLGQAMIAANRFATAEMTATFARARQLGEQLGDANQLVFTLVGLWGGSNARGELRTAQELADQMLAAAQRDGTPATLIWAHLAQGVTLDQRGHLQAAMEQLERARALYDEDRYRTEAFDPMVTVLSEASLVAWHLGFPDRARQLDLECRALAERRSNPFEIVSATTRSAGLHAVELGDLTAAGVLLATALANSREQPLPLFVALGTAFRGYVLAAQGHLHEGIAALREALATLVAAGHRVSIELYLGWLGKALALSGACGEALATIDDAFKVTSEETLYEPELLRIRGDILLRTGGAPDRSGLVGEGGVVDGRERAVRNRPRPTSDDVPVQVDLRGEAERCYRQSIERARATGSRSYELRTATCLAGLLQAQGRSAEARALLAPLYAWFTEGFDTRDLIEAKALLQQLES